MMLNQALKYVAPFIASFIASCDLSVDPNRGWLEILGMIDIEAGGNITVPDTVIAGAAFEVGFDTNGNSCVRGGGTKVVTQTAFRAVVEPRDYVPSPPPQSCDDIYNIFQHRVTVRFDQPGLATVAIRGLRSWSLTSPLDTVTIEHTVLVR
jgi:hypothetical protein